MISHTGTILRTSTSNQHNRMLLHIVSLSWNITVHNSSSTQANSGGLALSGIGLLWLCDSDFQAHALELWCVGCGHSRRGLLTRALGLAAAIGDLVEGCEDRRSGGEGAGDWGRGEEGWSSGGESWAEDRWREEAPYRGGEHDVWTWWVGPSR